MTAPDMPGRAPLPPLPPKWTGKYRRRPVVVEAVQLVDDDACDWDEIARWCGGRIYNIETSPGAEPQTLIDIRTLEGIMTAGEGWWVVRGIVGEFHPVRADIFEATYEPAAARLSAAPPGPRDPQAEQDHARWLGWMEASTYSTHPDDCDGMEEAFTAGMRVARDDDAATLAAEVRAGHVRIETGAGLSQSAPGAFIDYRCDHSHHKDSGAYRMKGRCGNCLSPLLALFTVGHDAAFGISGPDCPVCGRPAAFWDRLAAPDEIPADFEPQPAPGHLLVMRGTIALRDAEIELLREQLARTREEAGAVRRKLDIASTALCRLTTAAYPAEARVTASQALDAMDRVSVRDVAAPEKP